MYGLGSRLSGWSCGCRSRCWSSGNLTLRLLLCVTKNELIHILHANTLQMPGEGIAWLSSFTDPVLDAVLFAIEGRCFSVRDEVTEDLESALLRAFGLLRHDDPKRGGVLSTGSLKADHKHKNV